MKADIRNRFDPKRLVRANIAGLRPYSSARNEFAGSARIHLDANENSLGSPTSAAYNRYPDPYQKELKGRISAIEDIAAENIFIGNGSDEAIDLLFRVFCEPRIDNCIVCPPTYGMYEVSAGINDVEVRRAPLTTGFELDPGRVIAEADERTKLVFICSPNNPTGNAMDVATIARIAEELDAVIVVDEAYIHFSTRNSLAPEIGSRPNLVILRTFSKAWGLAGLRLGTAFADPEIVTLLNKVKPPYNISAAAQKLAIEAIENEAAVGSMIEEILVLREDLRLGLSRLPIVEKIFPSDSNFLLVRVPEPKAVYDFLADRGIVIRDRSRVELCEGCLRITVGTRDENSELLEALGKYKG